MTFITGAAMIGGNLDEPTRDQINKFLGYLDEEITTRTREEGIPPKYLRILQPLNYVVLVSSSEIILVATNNNVGGLPNIKFIDVKADLINLQSAIFLVERDLFYTDTFGFSFPRNTINMSDIEMKNQAKQVIANYIKEELLRVEKLNQMVRINPIFQGRDFIVNDKLVFMLSPFTDTFNTIYVDHIKPTIEKIDGINCLRADNIYDNKSIIEDIWKSINEASIIIAELTERNPNVFYEAGIAHTVGKEVILITQNMEDVPFDLRHLRCIVYEYTPRGMQSLEANLTNTINNIRTRKVPPII